MLHWVKIWCLVSLCLVGLLVVLYCLLWLVVVYPITIAAILFFVLSVLITYHVKNFLEAE